MMNQVSLRTASLLQCLKRNTTDIISNLQREIGDEEYVKYLEAIPAEKTHAGYFSIDKKGRMVDEYAGKKKVENSDDVSAYDLIMKNTLRCWKK
jgi:restriction endonuclease